MSLQKIFSIVMCDGLTSFSKKHSCTHVFSIFTLPLHEYFLFRALSNYISLSNIYNFRKNVKTLFNATVNLAYFLSFLCQDIISLGQVA